MWRDAKAAYKSWWGQITMLLSALAVFNYVVRVVGLDLSVWMTEVVGTYRTIFYPLVDLLASPFNLTLTDWQKDFALVWLAVGGATARTHVSELSANTFVKGSGRFTWTRIAGWAVTPFAFAAWPAFWAGYFRKPYFAEHDAKVHKESPFTRESQIDPRHSYIVADMRVVLLIQTLTVATVVVVLVGVNELGLL